MIRKFAGIFFKYKIWLITIIIMNIMFGVFLWLIAAHNFIYIFPTMLIGSFMLYSFIGFKVYKIDKRKENVIRAFIENPSLHEDELNLSFFANDEKSLIHLMAKTLRKKDEIIKNQDFNLQEYKEYIETWAHEIKTPLTLMTFVLDNRRDELLPIVYNRLEYARTKMQEDIERMLYYARLKSNHIDYLFTNVSLDEICTEIIEEYKILLDEQKINIHYNVKDIQVISDKKGLLFLLRQVMSNSIKYTNREESTPFISIFTDNHNKNQYIKLTIRDNGIGIKPYDLPFLFDKGYTGDTGEYRKQSTGMGLYLAKQVANDLNIKIEISEEYTKGLEISFLFPIVECKMNL